MLQHRAVHATAKEALGEGVCCRGPELCRPLKDLLDPICLDLGALGPWHDGMPWQDPIVSLDPGLKLCLPEGPCALAGFDRMLDRHGLA